MNSRTILELKAVSKEYKDHQGRFFKAVNNINLTMNEGECVGIVGESGCGKSTIAKMICQFTDVSSGKIIFRGKDHVTFRKRDFYKNVQMIFQDPLATFSPRMKIGTYLIEPFVNFKILTKKQALAFSGELLEMVGLEKEALNRYPYELSGGQLQRVVIARAIGIKPDLVICDECTSALDVTVQQQILNLFIKLREKTSFSSLFITHDLAVAESLCDKIYVMRLGEVVEVLSGGPIVTDAKHPYTKKLISSVLSVDEKGNGLGAIS
ncbi:dipeptide/oligopeptide/nickel ABC transporter ATP-binding protein [Bacillus sp. B15-48]|uniref:ABC transporter ATP-binding protein n=1 Tax=Bacillus sp. B15-48 TaxID=1548601 RepID=UPI00193F7E07|nr:dipeptide/oligopeptide/nickel ABC transporter ATP-binding protein [Bacillus sp. B15-48]MBM4763013.1 ATP-binding cassette domain-containing protein [Bacillus sp. B15-48]